jgi:hypothetical protein
MLDYRLDKLRETSGIERYTDVDRSGLLNVMTSAKMSH